VVDVVSDGGGDLVVVVVEEEVVVVPLLSSVRNSNTSALGCERKSRSDCAHAIATSIVKVKMTS
jgi:hypothetical protein